MKIFIASDIHGSEYYCREMLKRFKDEKCDTLVLLGDILYHGPRNDLPRDYNPKGVIELLNAISERIICVRGNCDTEVDQMVLDFPIMAEYAYIFIDGVNIIATHGHNAVKKLEKNKNVILGGHTHVPYCENFADYTYLNPGSVSIPKEESAHSYMTFDGTTFEWKNIQDGSVYKNYKIEKKTYNI